MQNDRLRRQLEFITEVDRLKTVLRRTTILDRSRQENSAEHSWHVALMVLVLAEHGAPKGIDLSLVHDLVEVDAGDTFCYDAAAMAGKALRESKAADRIFGLLPPDQGDELRAAWEEFEAKATPEARLAAALDRLQPVLHNLGTEGHAWREHGISREQVLSTNRIIGEVAPVIWEYVKERIDDATERGWLRG